MRVALLQRAVEDGAPRENLAAVLATLDGLDCDLLLLPELWTTGYAHDQWPDVADHETPGVRAALADAARRTGCVIAGSMIARTDAGGLVNRLETVGPKGVLATYDKAHLFGPMDEPRYLQAGRARVRCDLGDGVAAFSLCYDLRFPEMYRLDAADGATMFIVPSAWPAERIETMRLLARARAAENQAWLLLCNRVGDGADGTRFGGGSMVIGPEGNPVAEAGTEPATVVAEVRHEEAHRLRETFPVLPNRQPGVDTV